MESTALNTRVPSWPILVVFVSSVVATVLLWLVRPPAFLSVSPSEFATLNMDYAPQVNALLTGTKEFSARYPPIFPLLLVGLYHLSIALHLQLGVTLAIFIASCTGIGCSLVYVLARSVWGAGFATLLSAILWSWYIIPLWLTTYPSPETPFILVLVGSVLVFWKAVSAREFVAWRLAIAGVLIGVAMLIRPIALGIGIIFALLFCFLRRDLRTGTRVWLAALLLGANILTILPWEVWVFRQYGKIVPLSTGGAQSTLDGLTYAVDPHNNRNARIPADVEELQRDILARQEVELRSMSAISSYLADEFARRPIAVVKLFALKAANSWYATDSTRYDKYVLILQALFLPLSLLGTWHAWRRGGQARHWAIVVWSITLWLWAMTIVVLSIARYMTPAMALMVTLIPGALLQLDAVRAKFRASLGEYRTHPLTTTDSAHHPDRGDIAPSKNPID